MHYKSHKASLKQGRSYIDLPNWIKIIVIVIMIMIIVIIIVIIIIIIIITIIIIIIIIINKSYQLWWN